VAALVTTSGSQTAVVAKPSVKNAAAELTQLPSRHLIGANVHIVKQPDITAIRNARTAKVPAIYSSACGIQPRSKRATFNYFFSNITSVDLIFLWSMLVVGTSARAYS